MALNTSTIQDGLVDEAIKHLQALIQCNTTNPPGNEILAAQYIREQLIAEDIETQIYEAAPGRASLWARLPGNGTKRSLLLLSHLDVVPAEHGHWTVDPFSGEIHEGYVYGRGAVDMKGMTAKQLALILHFAREQKEGRHLSRDVNLLAVADEERHGTLGMGWIATHEPDLLANTEYSINEGGGFAVELGGKRIYLCSTAQKGAVEITLRAQGEPGHGSVPHQEQAIARLARALHRLTLAPLPLHRTQTVAAFLATLAGTQPVLRRLLLPQALNPFVSETILSSLATQTANGLRAMLHNTVAPTILEAGKAINVIPGEAHARLDGRILPGQSAETLSRELRQRIADPRVLVETEMVSAGYEGRSDTELLSVIRAAIAIHDPGALVAPYLLPAISDSRFLATRGITAYGFDPMQPEVGWPAPQQMAHGHDERISVANVGFGLRVLHEAILRISR